MRLLTPEVIRLWSLHYGQDVTVRRGRDTLLVYIFPKSDEEHFHNSGGFIRDLSHELSCRILELYVR